MAYYGSLLHEGEEMNPKVYWPQTPPCGAAVNYITEHGEKKYIAVPVLVISVPGRSIRMGALAYKQDGTQAKHLKQETLNTVNDDEDEPETRLKGPLLTPGRSPTHTGKVPYSHREGPLLTPGRSPTHTGKVPYSHREGPLLTPGRSATHTGKEDMRRSSHTCDLLNPLVMRSSKEDMRRSSHTCDLLKLLVMRSSKVCIQTADQPAGAMMLYLILLITAVCSSVCGTSQDGDTKHQMLCKIRESCQDTDLTKSNPNDTSPANDLCRAAEDDLKSLDPSTCDCLEFPCS
ncbi:hypothetical protein Bbelb_216690 [Branchiostoma belcheri]|nr:hypothetical protein Bbelb_216690 [Branchiostoma belcheri]